MRNLKKCMSAAVAAAVMVSCTAVYADTTLKTYVDDEKEKFSVSGTFDNSHKDWVTLAVYEGKLTSEGIQAMSDDELKSNLKYFKQAEFDDKNYNFSFEFTESSGWYTVFVSSFEEYDNPLLQQMYYYSKGDMQSVVDGYNSKISGTASDDEKIAELKSFFELYSDSFFSGIKYYYDISEEGKKDICRSQMGMEGLDLISEIATRVESKSTLRMLSEYLTEDSFDAKACVDFIAAYINELCLDGYAETEVFMSEEESFKNRVAQRMINTKMDDIPLALRENVVLTQIENISNAAMVKAVLESAEKSLGIELDNYNSFNEKSVINEELAGTAFDSIDDILEKIDSVIADSEESDAATNKNSGGSRGSSGGVAVAYPVTENETELTQNSKSVFTDFSESHWAYTAANYLREKGVISGYPDNTFRPESKITRAEFIKLIASTLNITAAETVSSFADISSDEWYAPYVAAGEKYGIVYGDENGNFRPDDAITRQDAAVIVYRAAMFAGVVFEPVNEDDNFKDYDSIASYALSEVNTLKANGILKGDNGFFYPTENATRAEMSQLMYSLLMII